MKMTQKLPKRIERYLREQSACCRPSTVAGYRMIVGRFYKQLKAISKNPIGSLTKEELRDFVSSLCGRDLAPYTKVNYLLAVRKYLCWEAENGKLSGDLPNVLDRSKLPPVPEYLPRPLSTENDRHLQKIWRESDHPYAPLFLLLRQTGLRIGELINLAPEGVVTNGNSNKYLKVPLGKMNNERLVPLAEETIKLIEKIKASPPPKKNRWDPNRLIGLSGPVSSVYRLLAHRFKKIAGDITDGGKPITFHRLRHTYATTLLTGGVSLVSLMKLLGHRRIEMTLRYAKVMPSHLRDEYLKAVKILEQQSIPNHQPHSPSSASECHPAEILEQLRSFLAKTFSASPPLQQKNLLRRVDRLQKDLNQIQFPQKFKPDFLREECLVRLAG